METTDSSLDATGRTKIRHVRIADELWLPACQRANEEGATISEIVRFLLRNYVERGYDKG
jgi:hypothetical protein